MITYTNMQICDVLVAVVVVAYLVGTFISNATAMQIFATATVTGSQIYLR